MGHSRRKPPFPHLACLHVHDVLWLDDLRRNRRAWWNHVECWSPWICLSWKGPTNDQIQTHFSNANIHFLVGNSNAIILYHFWLAVGSTNPSWKRLVRIKLDDDFPRVVRVNIKETVELPPHSTLGICFSWKGPSNHDQPLGGPLHNLDLRLGCSVLGKKSSKKLVSQTVVEIDGDEIHGFF